MNTEDLKSVYHDVLNGYSFYTDKKISFYIKHFGLKDLNLIQRKRLETENKAKQSGLLEEEIQLKNLIEKDNWSLEKENQITKYESFIKDLKYTKSRLLKSKDIENINNKI